MPAVRGGETPAAKGVPPELSWRRKPKAARKVVHMELRQLRYFLAVAERLHFARAAESLHISQPTLSQQIRALEEELGVQLFQRNKRHVALTADGEALLAYARQLVALADDVREEFAERSGLRRGRVRLGATPTLGSHLVPRVIGGFFKMYPGLELTLCQDGSDGLVRQLEQGGLDLALLAEGQEAQGIAFEPLLEEEIVVVLGPEHPLAGRASVRMEELREEGFILCGEGYRLRSLTLAACESAGFTPRTAVNGTDIHTALQFVQAGLGVTLAPRLAVEGVAGVAVARIEAPALKRTVGIAWNPQRYLSQAATAMRDYLMGVLRRGSGGIG